MQELTKRFICIFFIKEKAAKEFLALKVLSIIIFNDKDKRQKLNEG
jgi:hypothetical protein